jgi:hypothetical protein
VVAGGVPVQAVTLRMAAAQAFGKENYTRLDKLTISLPPPDATKILNADKRAASKLWMEDGKSKLSPDLVYKVISGPQVKWTLVPENTMRYATFMPDVGMIKTAPPSWKDRFFPEIQSVPGS